MKIIKNLSSCLIIAFLVNLSTCDSTNSNIQYKTITFSHSNQQFTIVPFYLHMPTYIEKAKKNKRQIDRIYKKLVYRQRDGRFMMVKKQMYGDINGNELVFEI